jgi:hypothetical protein
MYIPNASNFALSVMMGQNLKNIIDKPIYYVSRLMSNAKRNYSTIGKETLAMIYVVIVFDIIF